MSFSAVFRRLVFRGLIARIARWAIAPALAAALLVGIGSFFSAATATVSVSGVGTANPVLRQVGSTWQTTVLVTDTAAGCAQANVQYWLATTPGGVVRPAGSPGAPGTVAGTATDGSACEVTVAFSDVAQVPATAVLVVNQSGASAAVTLTVSRDVTSASYLGLPALAGVAAVLLYLLFLLSVKVYDWQGDPHRPAGNGHMVDTAWWKHSIAGSGAWSAGDSWATNVSTGLVVVSAFLAATTASSSLFPGVALDRFALVNILAGVFVVAAPVLFGILYTFVTGRDPGPSADSVVQVPSGRQVVLRLPSGGTITLVTDTTVTGAPDGSRRPVIAGDSYQIAPGSLIAVDPPGAPENPETVKIISFSGTSDIGVQRGATVHILTEPTDPITDNAPLSSDFSLQVTGGAKITVTGTGGVRLPQGAVITGPRRQQDRRPARAVRWLLVPQGSTVIVGRMGIMVAANVLTMFGIGAELGIGFVLAGLSDADGAWGYIIYAGLAALAGFLLWYAISATQAMANPQPGSALSAQAGTSFTL